MKRAAFVMYLFIGILALLSIGILTAEEKLKTEEPKVTALVCSFRAGSGERTPEVGVIGGFITGRGWVGSRQTKGMLHKGDKLSLYALEDGEIGEVLLSDEGEIDPGDKPYETGLFFEAQAIVSREKQAIYEKVAASDELPFCPLAAWASDGKAPRWVKGKVLEKSNRKYGGIVTSWLRSRGTPKEVLEKIIIEQIVSADINSDKKDELFLSFRSADTPSSTLFMGPTNRTFSYIIMQYSPPGSKEVRTVIVTDYVNNVHKIIGFCDLNGDGWAEVIVARTGVDMWGCDLHYWTGKSFEYVDGWGGGA